MNKRNARLVRLGGALAVILPKDFCTGNELKKGDLVEMLYNGEVRVRPKDAEGP